MYSMSKEINYYILSQCAFCDGGAAAGAGAAAGIGDSRSLIIMGLLMFHKYFKFSSEPHLWCLTRQMLTLW